LKKIAKQLIVTGLNPDGFQKETCLFMKYYPINLNILNKEVLVVGGGPVGLRKAQALLDCGAYVTIVSPSFSEETDRLQPRERVQFKIRPFEEADLEGKFLVLSATDDVSLNQHISKLAHNRNMLCNIADFPEACNFILPSIVRQGDFVLAISTSGQSPAFAKAMRKKLSDQFGLEYKYFLDIMGALRKKLLAEKHAPEEHKLLFEKVIQEGLLEKVALRNVSEIDTILQCILGKEFSLSDICPEAYVFCCESEEKK